MLTYQSQTVTAEKMRKALSFKDAEKKLTLQSMKKASGLPKVIPHIPMAKILHEAIEKSLQQKTTYPGASRFKDEIYGKALRKIRKHKIQGSYQGLPASRIHEIISYFEQATCGHYIYWSENGISQELGQMYNSLLQKRWDDRKFTFRRTLDFTQSPHRKDTHGIAIFDYDFMGGLNSEAMTRIAQYVNQHSANKSILITTSGLGRSGCPTRNDYDGWSRPKLLEELEKNHDICSHESLAYKVKPQGGIPMRVEQVVMQRTN